jgi:Serine/threonine protein kinase
MSRKSWAQVKEVFHEALRRDTAEREIYLEEACEGDVSFRIDVESLLISLAEAESFLEQPVVGEISKPATWRLQNGQQISHYRIVEPIGIGGMGEVYLADDLRLNRQVALKILPEQMLADRDRLRRFQREADVVSALNHPNILTIYEFDTDGDIHLFASEFVKGETLREKLSRGRLSVSDTLDIALQIVSALNAAHEAGVIHRDIKPENVMIRDDGYVKVLDFGLAKQTESKASDPFADTRAMVVSQPGLIMGTVAYMSPEQVRARPIDSRTDLFSLGIVLYEMLSGKSPFTGETTTDVIAATLQVEPDPLTQSNKLVPADLDITITKLLEKDRNDRYQTARDVQADLKQVQKQVELRGNDEVIATGRDLAGNTTEILPARSKESDNLFDGSDWRRRNVAAVLFITAILVLGAAYWYFASGPKKQIESIAVMPFVNDSGDADIEYLSDGMTETLISSLSQIPKLNVKARSSVFRYKGKDTNAQIIGKELNVQAILNGRVVQRGDNLTLYVELVDAQTENSLWKQTYNKTITNLVSLQNEIGRDVADKLKVKLSGEDERKLAKNYTENSQAYSLYLKGRYFWDRRTNEGIENAVKNYTDAIALDPNYALAYAGLADCYLFSKTDEPPNVTIPKTRTLAMKALELDDTLAEAHTTLAFVKMRYDYDWTGAEQEFKQAIALNPNYPVVHQFYGTFLVNTGRTDEGLSEIHRALELDPLSVTINWSLGINLYHARRYNEAITQLQNTLQMNPNHELTLNTLALAYAQKGMYADALATLQKLDLLLRESTELEAQFSRAYIYALSGRREEAHRMLLELKDKRERQYGSELGIAKIHIALDGPEQALASLNQAFENRDFGIIFLKVDPTLDPLRGDSRFRDLEHRVGF